MFALYCDPLIRVYVPADRPHKFTTFVRLMDMIAACLCDPLIVVSVPAEAICQFTTFGRSLRKQPLDWSPLLEVCDGVMAVAGGGVMLVKSVSNVVCW
jgi:hypothetical protein